MKNFILLVLFICTVQVSNAQVIKSVAGCVAGDLSFRLTSGEKSTVTTLIISGTLDARDFKFMRDDMPVLLAIYMSGVDIVAYSGTDGPLSPTNYSYPANELPWYAFYNLNTGYGKTSLVEIELPPTITSIGRYAFGYCRGITTLSIPASVTNIDLWAFTDCGNNLAMNIPAGVTTIGNWAFEAFNGPITVDASNPNYTSYNDVLFNKDTTLLIQCPASKSGEYLIPSTVTSIGQNSFSRCSRLTGSIIIPPSVTTIGGWAFRECTGLTGPLSIPETVVSIGNGAFYLCSALTSIYAYSEVPIDLSLTSSVFQSINKTTCSLYVPGGSKRAYQAANQWQDFTNIIEQSSNFPYTEGFSSGIVPYGWKQIDYPDRGQLWRFGVITSSTLPPDLTGNYVYLHSDFYGLGNTQNVDLISPVFDFSNYTNIALGFNQYYRAASLNPVSLSYSVNNGVDWNLIQSWSTSTNNPDAFLEDLTTRVAGYSQVLFKWNYHDTYGWYWAIDDVTITADYIVSPTETLSDLTIGDYESHCYDATETITVAGDGNPVEFLSGSAVDLISGESIHLLEGFHAHSGSNVNAYITTVGAFCNTLPEPIVALPGNKSEFIEDEIKPTVIDEVKRPWLMIYPNPNNGKFTIALDNIEKGSGVAIYNALGSRVFCAIVGEENQQQVDLSVIGRGLYIVKVSDRSGELTKKILIE